MRIIYKEPGKGPVERDVPNELHALQELIGGQMETVRITQQVLAIVNEEGIPRRLPYNCGLNGWFNAPRIYGPLFFVGEAGEDFCDLPDSFTVDMAMEVIV